MNQYLYYPGCSLEGSARAYGESIEAVCAALDIELHEIPDWNCCGATEYLGLDVIPAYSLISRNLALAASIPDGNRELVAACSACYLNLAKADHYMAERPKLGQQVNQALWVGGLHYEPGSLKIRHLLDVIVHDTGLDAVKAKVVRPLTGLKVAPYLGCMLTRPDYEDRWSDHEHPTEFIDLLAALGADVVEYPLQTACCGGHMTQIGPKTAFELIHGLISAAVERRADLMVTICPMCQMNVDAYQGETNRYFNTKLRMPIVFFTQLMALALGVPAERAGFGRELVSAEPALEKIGAQAPAPAAAARHRKPEGLPMPPRLIRRNDAQHRQGEASK